MVYLESLHTSIIDSIANKLGILKLHLNNIDRNKFGGNENRTFCVWAEMMTTPFFY